LVSPGAPQAQQVSYTAVTDSQGRFSIQSIRPGAYRRLTATRSGYVQTEYGSRGQGRPGTLLTLAPRQSLTSLELRMRRHGVIAGKVVDETGEPVQEARVSALRSRYLNGEWQLATSGSASTDDLGNFRVFGLDPGRYFVRVTPGSMSFSLNPTAVNASQPQQSHLPVYYPGTTDQSAAAPVEVESGQTVAGLLFTLTRGRAFRVQVQVPNATGMTGTIMAALRPRKAMSVAGDLRMSVVDPKGRVNFQGVSPGSFTLSVSAASEEGKPWSASMDIDIVDRDETNLSLVLAPALELPGEIRAEDAPNIALKSLRVTASGPGVMRLMTGSATYSFGSSGNAQIGEDGKFVLTGMSPDKSDVNVTSLPEGVYIKSIQFNEQEILESGLDLSKGTAGSLLITVRGDGATLEGAVTDKDSKPVTAATVVLIPKPAGRRSAAKFYKNTSTDQQGRFSLKSVMPGEYRAYAWEDVETMAWMDPAFVKTVEDKGVDVTIDPNGRQQLSLTAIPAK
jgi:protocatechuate 3,4-dioxygenase beta subunit